MLQFGWSIKSTDQKLVPTTHDKDIKSETLGKVILLVMPQACLQ